MNADFEDSELAAALRASTAEARSQLDDHPTSDRLLAYHDRELADDEAKRLREHLSLCSDCARRALDLEAFSREAVADSSEDVDADAAWGRTRRKLLERGLIPEALDSTRGRSGFGLAPRWAYAAAAVFFLVSLGLSVRLVEMNQAFQQLAGPRADPQILSPRPVGIGGQRAGSASETIIAASDKDLVLILNVLEPGPAESYLVEVSSARGQFVRADVSLSPEADFTVFLPARLLPAGDYEIHLYSVDGSRRDLLAEYELLVADKD